MKENEFVWNIKALKAFGFLKKENRYIYEKNINSFLKAFFIIEDNDVRVEVKDIKTKEIYMPFYIESASGAYVIKVRNTVDDLKKEIIKNCTKNKNLKEEILSFVKKRYNTTPIYPWPKIPSACTLKVNDKWYGVMMNLSYKSLKVDKEGNVDILNIKLPTEKIEELIDKETFYPAYHMNKKNWITIALTANADIALIENLIEISYHIVKENA